jgi:hypothetical protein
MGRHHAWPQAGLPSPDSWTCAHPEMLGAMPHQSPGRSTWVPDLRRVCGSLASSYGRHPRFDSQDSLFERHPRAERTSVRFGYRRGENGVLVPHEASKSRSARWLACAAGKPLRAIAEACRRWGHRISHEGVGCVLKLQATSRRGEIRRRIRVPECEVRRWFSPRTKLKLILLRLRRRGQ